MSLISLMLALWSNGREVALTYVFSHVTNVARLVWYLFILPFFLHNFMPTALHRNTYGAQLVAYNALLLEMLCYSSKSSFLLFTSSPSIILLLLSLSYLSKKFCGIRRGEPWYCWMWKEVWEILNAKSCKKVWTDWSFLLCVADTVLCKVFIAIPR